MCGVAGFLDINNPQDSESSSHRVSNIIQALVHRGPDETGTWIDSQAGIAMALSRLAIIDLSPTGHQPMVSSCGRYVLAFNGEIYNFRTLRVELEALGRQFRGKSDTEVLLEGISEWGLEATLRRTNGMFGLAVWDRSNRQLFLARDRVGLKPMYFGWVNNSFVFASELKGILASGTSKPAIDRNALSKYLRVNCVPAPYTIYQGIFKLPPGMILSVNSDIVARSRTLKELAPQLRSYWKLYDVIAQVDSNLVDSSSLANVDELHDLLRDSVSARMVSDVPLGALLSGGIDSTMIVALMQAQSHTSIKTFSIGFDDPVYDEAGHAKSIANYLGTDHTELYLSQKDMIDILPELPRVYDEPYSDSSAIPTMLVSQLTRKFVTVALSGDGGDELFGGYQRYYRAQAMFNRIRRVPVNIRPALASILTKIPPVAWEGFNTLAGFLLPSVARNKLSADHALKLSSLLKSRSHLEFYQSFTGHWEDPNSIVIGAHPHDSVLDATEQLPNPHSLFEQMMYMDTITYLPDDILTKIDRASMAVSLEVRCPLLDHRIIEYSWRIPTSQKFQDGNSKWLLREVLNRYVPRDLVDRPKMGFGVPLASLLRGPLRGWAEEMLSEDRLRRDGIFQARPIRQKWSEHLANKRDWHYHLWDILMFQAWFHEN